MTLRIGTFRLRFKYRLVRTYLGAPGPACLTIAGFGQTPPPSTSPPPYQSLRYDEDWTYLSDKSQRSDAFDVLKYIPLLDRGYLSLGGEARIRYEYFDQFDFGLGYEEKM